jgi:hypothetical protein
MSPSAEEERSEGRRVETGAGHVRGIWLPVILIVSAGWVIGLLIIRFVILPDMEKRIVSQLSPAPVASSAEAPPVASPPSGLPPVAQAPAVPSAVETVAPVPATQTGKGPSGSHPPATGTKPPPGLTSTETTSPQPPVTTQPTTPPTGSQDAGVIL